MDEASAVEGEERAQRAERAMRFVDVQSGRSDLLGRVAALESLAAVIARRLEGSRPGSRFPLLRLVGRATPLGPEECEALAREIARLREVLAQWPAARVADDEDDRRALDAFPRPGSASAPHSLAEAFAWPLGVLEHVALLGWASRRGARFEVGDEEELAASRLPLAISPPSRRGG